MATDTDQQRVWFAREVLQLFVKCFTNLKLFPHHHVHVKSAMDAFTGRLRTFVGMHEVLRIGVSQDNLTVEDQPIYEEENRNENLAFRLYVDGLREIAIVKGVTVEEAQKLAMVFYEAIVDTKIDSTLLLWEADFRNIEYVAINSLSEQWDQPDYLSQDALKLLRDMNTDVQGIVQNLTAPGARDTYSFELSDGGKELERAKEIEAGSEDREQGEDIFAIDDGALQAFQREVMAWGPDRALRAIVEASLDGYAVARDVLDQDLVRWLLREAVEMSLRNKDLELLASLLQRLEGELQLVDEDEEDEAEAVFRSAFVYLRTPQNLERLAETVLGQAIGGPKAYVRVLGLLGEGSASAAVQAFLKSETKELRDALLAFLGDRVTAEPLALLPMLDPSVPGEIARSALFLVSKKVRGKPLEELLGAARKHKDGKVTEYATQLWRTTTDEGRLQTLMESIFSEHKPDRLRAAAQLAQAAHRPALEPLKKAIEAAAFLQRDKDERAAFFDGVLKCGGQAAIAFLQQQAQRSGGLFNRGVINETREMANAALEKLKKGR